MYKLIAIDLDGTLLNSYGEISNENKEALKKLNENGTYVVLTSGRPSKSIENFCNEINSNKYLISGNGTIIYDIEQETEIFNKNMEKQKVLSIIKILEENSIYYSVFTENLIIAPNFNYNILFYNNENKNKPENKKTNINIVQDMYNYIEKSNIEKFAKICVCDKDKVIFTSIINNLRKIKNIDVLDVAHMSRKIIKSGIEDVPVEYYYTEITNKDVNKWGAINFLAQKLNITREEIVAIGDNVNDIEMIRNAGLGVAMGNSSPVVKEIANVVIDDNNTNAISKFVTKLQQC